jgi:hypothetical protein
MRPLKQFDIDTILPHPTPMHSSLEPPASLDRSSLVAPDGSVEIGNVRAPYSVFATEEARNTFLNELRPPPPEIANDLAALRASRCTASRQGRRATTTAACS